MPGPVHPQIEHPPGKWRVYGTLGPLVVLLFLWLWVLSGREDYGAGPNGVGYGQDFTIAISAAEVLKEGGNPYDKQVLLRTERSFLRRNGVPARGIPKRTAYTNVTIHAVHIPFLYWALEPLTALPFKAVALTWIALLIGLLFGGLWATLRSLGWRRPVVPCAIFLAMPQTALAVYYANFNAVMFAGIGGSLALIGRYPLIAGALLGIEWLKPQVGLPFALLVVVMHRHVWRRVVVGFSAVTALLLLAPIPMVGTTVVRGWIGASSGYAFDVGRYADIATAAGFYMGRVPAALYGPLSGLLLLTVTALTGAWCWR